MSNTFLSARRPSLTPHRRLCAFLPRIFLGIGIGCLVTFFSLSFDVEVHAQSEPAAGKSGNLKPDITREITAKVPTSLNEVVATFVIDLIHKNTGGVQDLYRKRTAKTEEDAGGRYSTHKFEAIQWFVVELSEDPKENSTSEDGEYIYIARQQLVFGIHRGYSVPTNVLAKVRVVTHWEGKSNAAKTDDKVLPGTKITLTFEGFLDSAPTELPGDAAK